MAFLEINDVEIKAVAAAVPKQVKVVKEQPFFTDIEAENFTKTVTLAKAKRTAMSVHGREG